jgi:hypothetical protein
VFVLSPLKASRSFFLPLGSPNLKLLLLILASFERTFLFLKPLGKLGYKVKKGKTCSLAFTLQPNKNEIMESEVGGKYGHVRLVFLPNSKLMKKNYTLLEPTVINSRTAFPL